MPHGRLVFHLPSPGRISVIQELDIFLELLLPPQPLCGQNPSSLPQQHKPGFWGRSIRVTNRQSSSVFWCRQLCFCPDQDAFFNVTAIAQVLMQMDSQRPLISSVQNSSQIFLRRVKDTLPFYPKRYLQRVNQMQVGSSNKGNH